jgi:hypothetical protein
MDSSPTSSAVRVSSGWRAAPEAFGDPEAVADAVMAVTALEEPPLRPAVGADAVAHIRASLRSRLAELDRWESFPRVPVRDSA